MGDTDLDIVIVSAGATRRFRLNAPKSTVCIKDKPLIYYQLNLFRKIFPNSDIIVVGGFQADILYQYIQKWNQSHHNCRGIRFVQNDKYDTTNVSKSVNLGLRAAVGKRVLIVYGDLLFYQNPLPDLHKESFALIDQFSLFKKTEVGLTIVDGYVTIFSYGLITKWAQMVYLVGDMYSQFRKIISHESKDKHFYFEILNDMLDNGGKLKAVSALSEIYDIDTLNDVKRLT